ncbi:MAG: hypothetical protein ACAI37_01760 [Chthoniobacter sp.]
MPHRPRRNGKIIASRGITNRVTAETGPLAPIFADDWPYKALDDRQTVWRYLTLSKFEDLLRTSELYFRRCDKFVDGLEGTISKREIDGTSRSDRLFHTVYPIAHDYDDAAAAQAVTRACLFVNCWHINSRESATMWNEYTPEKDAVAVVSSGKALKSSLPLGILVSPVAYVNESQPRIAFDNVSLCFYKDVSFRHERELRLLRPTYEGEHVLENDPTDFARRVPVSLEELLQRVVVKPTISDAGRDSVTALCRAFCPHATLEDSCLPLSSFAPCGVT